MTLKELLKSNLFDNKTEFRISTTGDDIRFDPDDYFVVPAFGDCIIDRVVASGENAVKIFFDIEVKRRRETA